MDELFPSPPNQQATNQILAIIVTLAFALVGGLVTGMTREYGRGTDVNFMFKDSSCILWGNLES